MNQNASESNTTNTSTAVREPISASAEARRAAAVEAAYILEARTR